ncbi:sterile alpha motif domain-containing protein 1 [Microcaecilia unicolor]|uniref:Atherin n=1 Tax=Microcaecilia unicolor TaxID=1415580 RepID=A0A6P7XQR3_9AMPH|nr:atherin [Microcaecilia unicolor]
MAGPPPPPPQPNPRYEEWILDTIDSLRSRKARPDLERICRMVRRRHGPEPERTRQELERLIQRRAVLRVSYKGSISYRNAARVQPPRGRRGAAAGGQPQPSLEQEQRRPEMPPRCAESHGQPGAAERETPPHNRTKGPEEEEAEREAPRSRAGANGESAPEREPLERSRSRCRGQAEEEPEEPRTRSAPRRPPGRGSNECLTRGRAREQRRRQQQQGRLQRRRSSPGRTPARCPRAKKTEQPAEEEEEVVSMLSEGSEVPDDEEEEAGNMAEDGKLADVVTPEVAIKQEVKPAESCRMNGDLWLDGKNDGLVVGEASRHTDNSKYLACQDPLPERGIGTCHPLKAASKEPFNSSFCPPIKSILGGTFARAVEETVSRDSIACPPDPSTATDFPLEADKTERDAEEQRKESGKTERAFPHASEPLSPAQSLTQRVDGISCRNSSIKKEKLSDPVEWTVTDVVDYFTEAGFGDQAYAFKEQEIDGKSLLLMQRTDVLTGLSIRLGPALKIYEYHIKVLQQCHFEEGEGDYFLG